MVLLYKCLQHALAHVPEALISCALYDDDLPVDISGPSFGQVALHHFFVPFSLHVLRGLVTSVVRTLKIKNKKGQSACPFVW